VLLQVPDSALKFGFMNDPVGTHGSRTIMLKELRMLLAACPRPTDYEEFRTRIVEDNVLLKNTASTRKESFRRLRELYALDEGTLLFRSLRDLWDADPERQPVLALLCATARDSILRATADLILSVAKGETVTPQMIEGATEEAFPGRYNPTMLANVGRHAASTWEQSGHLEGHRNKVRAQAEPTPAATAYALLLAHLSGSRGEAMFETLWLRLLDVPKATRHDLASQASRLGWLEYRHTGAVTEISFDYLLRDVEESKLAT
jgi:hypothetical protein